MRRREFITLLDGAAASWPLAAGAQQGGKRATIGLLGSGTAAAQSNWTAAFVQRLHDLGWSESRNLAIEYRWGEGRSERFAKLADELARLKVDVIVTHNTQSQSRHRAGRWHCPSARSHGGPSVRPRHNGP
jgi:putative ABC transport system substrate-binding protein